MKDSFVLRFFCVLHGWAAADIGKKTGKEFRKNPGVHGCFDQRYGQMQGRFVKNDYVR